MKTILEKVQETGLAGRKTREEIVKWNQMTALRFQRGVRHQTFSASLRGEGGGERGGEREREREERERELW